MNLPRLRELVQAGKDGTLRPKEAKELFEALPEVLGPYKPTDEQRRDPVIMAAVAMGMSAHETLQLVWQVHTETRRSYEAFLLNSARPAVFVLPSRG